MALLMSRLQKETFLTVQRDVLNWGLISLSAPNGPRGCVCAVQAGGGRRGRAAGLPRPDCPRIRPRDQEVGRCPAICARCALCDADARPSTGSQRSWSERGGAGRARGCRLTRADRSSFRTATSPGLLRRCGISETAIWRASRGTRETQTAHTSITRRQLCTGAHGRRPRGDTTCLPAYAGGHSPFALIRWLSFAGAKRAAYVWGSTTWTALSRTMARPSSSSVSLQRCCPAFSSSADGMPQLAPTACPRQDMHGCLAGGMETCINPRVSTQEGSAEAAYRVGMMHYAGIAGESSQADAGRWSVAAIAPLLCRQPSRR